MTAGGRALRWAVWVTPLALACGGEPDPPIPDITVTTLTVAFPDADPLLGSGERPMVTIRNDGDGLLTVSGIELRGDSVFSILEGEGAFTLFPNEFRALVLAFAPVERVPYSAALDVTSDDPDEGLVTVALSGSGARLRFRQVDRAGIPGLNRLFNHASGMQDFDLTAYNVTTPQDDTLYHASFETVLGWFGHSDPAGGRSELLPDALTVSLAADPVSFGAGTGRDLQDDALDAILATVMGDPALHSDHVDANDRTFLTAFPYLSEPHAGPGG